QSGQRPRRSYIDIVWPEISRFLEIWRTEKTSNYWAAGTAMQKKILAADLEPPQWPPKPSPLQNPPTSSKKGSDLDDDIPF
ncbi:hypothetical protein, partial [Hypericibacter sp.]|uniref:hypothetical protein n=1 Tax=Hypericibacter sp. TaxID=2705401 RepID=UPI003D6D499E